MKEGEYSMESTCVLRNNQTALDLFSEYLVSWQEGIWCGEGQRVLPF